jgi:hypothetical protein
MPVVILASTFLYTRRLPVAELNGGKIGHDEFSVPQRAILICDYGLVLYDFLTFASGRERIRKCLPLRASTTLSVL